MKPNICQDQHESPLRTNYGVFCMDCGNLDEFINVNKNNLQLKNPPLEESDDDES